MINIKDSKYEFVDIDEVAAQQKHLIAGQYDELAHVQCKYRKLFDGLELLVATLIVRCILIYSQEQDRCINAHIQ